MNSVSSNVRSNPERVEYCSLSLFNPFRVARPYDFFTIHINFGILSSCVTSVNNTTKMSSLRDFWLSLIIIITKMPSLCDFGSILLNNLCYAKVRRIEIIVVRVK